MSDFVVAGAQIECSKSFPPKAPGVLSVLPTGMVNAGDKPVATIMDMKPMVNIASFGTCDSSLNPTVIAATSAASGVHTPSACVPLPLGPWSPGSSKTTIGNLPALTKDSTCHCYDGTISIKGEGQQKASVG